MRISQSRVALVSNAFRKAKNILKGGPSDLGTKILQKY